MEISVFIENYREAFGEAAEMPLAFWYSDEEIEHTDKIGGCFFKGIQAVREGKTISLNAENIGCGGGKFYTGFTEMPSHVPQFVSLKEKYKKTPELVTAFVEELGVPRTEKEWLHFARIDCLKSFDGIEGILFLATPDVLSGLTTWTYFDTNAEDAVVTVFGSGCCSVVTQTILENRKQGKRTFIGFLDPSVRPWFEADLLSFTIPMSRFRQMYDTMRESCLFSTPAWGKIRERITKGIKKNLCMTQHPENLVSPVKEERGGGILTVNEDIVLREAVLKDAGLIWQAIQAHKDYLGIWLPFVAQLKSVADEEAFLKSMLDVPYKERNLVFVIEKGGVFCGLIGFVMTDLVNHRTEIGYWLLPEYQGQGIMTRSVRYLSEWAMENRQMYRIQIRCAVGNQPSNAIPRRLGFQWEGVERAGELMATGEYVDINVYSLLKNESTK